MTDSRGAIAAGNPQPALGNRSTETAGHEPWSLSAILAAIWIGGACCTAVAYAVRIRRFASGHPRVRGGAAGHSHDGHRALEPAGPEARARRADDVACPAAPGLVARTLPARDSAFRTLCPPESAKLNARSSPTNSSISGAATISSGSSSSRRTRSSGGIPSCGGQAGSCANSKSSAATAASSNWSRDQPRTYAAALVDTLEFLSEQPRHLVPLRTAIDSAGSLSRRIRMLTQRPNESSECPERHARRRTCRPSAGRCLRRRSGTGEPDGPQGPAIRRRPGRDSPRSRDRRGGRSAGRCPRARGHSRRGYAIRRSPRTPITRQAGSQIRRQRRLPAGDSRDHEAHDDLDRCDEARLSPVSGNLDVRRRPEGRRGRAGQDGGSLPDTQARTLFRRHRRGRTREADPGGGDCRQCRLRHAARAESRGPRAVRMGRSNYSTIP